MTISLPALLLLLVIAAVCGAIGKAIAGSARGGLIVSTQTAEHRQRGQLRANCVCR